MSRDIHDDVRAAEFDGFGGDIRRTFLTRDSGVPLVAAEATLGNHRGEEDKSTSGLEDARELSLDVLHFPEGNILQGKFEEIDR